MNKIAAVLVVIVIGLTVYSQRATIATRLLEKGIDNRMGADVAASFEDGLHLALCGAGGPMPAPDASGPCVAVVAGRHLFIVDAGTDGVRNLVRMGYRPGTVKAVFLTHFHSDHIDGLGELAMVRWVGAANATPLPVYGPDGVQDVVAGFNAAYAHDARYRQDHHGDTVAPLSGAGLVAHAFPQLADGELATIYSDADVTVQALTVDHRPVRPAVAYRFTYKDRSLLISGDTVRSDNVRRFADGVDLLVHEALAPNLVGLMHEAAEANARVVMAKILEDIPDYHSTPAEAAEIARDAGVGHLLYYHIVPPMIIPGQEAAWLDGADEIFPDYTVGRDGTSFSLPAGSTDIIQTRRGL